MDKTYYIDDAGNNIIKSISIPLGKKKEFSYNIKRHTEYDPDTRNNAIVSFYQYLNEHGVYAVSFYATIIDVEAYWHKYIEKQDKCGDKVYDDLIEALVWYDENAKTEVEIDSEAPFIKVSNDSAVMEDDDLLIGEEDDPFGLKDGEKPLRYFVSETSTNDCKNDNKDWWLEWEDNDNIPVAGTTIRFFDGSPQEVSISLIFGNGDCFNQGIKMHGLPSCRIDSRNTSFFEFIMLMDNCILEHINEVLVDIEAYWSMYCEFCEECDCFLDDDLVICLVEFYAEVYPNTITGMASGVYY